MKSESKIFPTLYKTGTKNKELEWTISVIPGDGGWIIRTVHGQVGGALQTSDVLITKGKNLGRTNATTAYEQAISEADSKWKKQFDKCYSQKRGGASKEYKPMLAHTYDDHKEKVKFPCFVQPKLDGCRCIAIRHDSHIQLLTRNGKEYLGLDHIRCDLMEIMSIGEVWDGEIYCHELTFQRAMSLIKKPQPESKLLTYNVYDVVHSSDFEERFLNLISDCITRPLLESVRFVDTLVANSHDDIIKHQMFFMADDYEGAMVRHSGCLYREGVRSHQLLKVKTWMDAEFEIVDIVPGIGKAEAQGTFVCKTNEGATFNAVYVADDKERKKILKDKHKYIGKPLTVMFFEWTTSENPVPRFPKGIRIREDV